MRIWMPEPDDPPLLEWWAPLVRAARHALDEEVPWLILLDEWAFRGRFLRRPRPDVWVYVHDRSRGELQVDVSGRPYKFIPNRSGPSPGRFKETDIRSAIWRAGLPYEGRAVWFGEPPPRPDLSLLEEPAAAAEEAVPGRGPWPGLRVVR